MKNIKLKVSPFFALFATLFISSTHCADSSRTKYKVTSREELFDREAPPTFNRELCSYTDINSIVDTTYDPGAKINCLQYLRWDAILQNKPAKEKKCLEALRSVDSKCQSSLIILGNKTQIPCIDPDFVIPNCLPDETKKIINDRVQQRFQMQKQSYNDVIKERNEELSKLQNQLSKQSSWVQKAQINKSINGIVTQQLNTLSRKWQHDKSDENKEEIWKVLKGLPSRDSMNEQNKGAKKELLYQMYEVDEKAQDERAKKDEIMKKEQEAKMLLEKKKQEEAIQEKNRKELENFHQEKEEKERRIREKKIAEEQAQKERIAQEKKAHKVKLKREKKKIDQAVQEKRDKADKARKNELEQQKLKQQKLEQEKLAQQKLEQEKKSRQKKIFFTGLALTALASIPFFFKFFVEKYPDLLTFSPFAIFKT